MLGVSMEQRGHEQDDVHCQRQHMRSESVRNCTLHWEASEDFDDFILNEDIPGAGLSSFSRQSCQDRWTSACGTETKARFKKVQRRPMGGYGQSQNSSLRSTDTTQPQAAYGAPPRNSIQCNVRPLDRKPGYCGSLIDDGFLAKALSPPEDETGEAEAEPEPACSTDGCPHMEQIRTIVAPKTTPNPNRFVRRAVRSA